MEEKGEENENKRKGGRKRIFLLIGKRGKS